MSQPLPRWKPYATWLPEENYYGRRQQSDGNQFRTRTEEEESRCSDCEEEGSSQTSNQGSGFSSHQEEKGQAEEVQTIRSDQKSRSTSTSTNQGSETVMPRPPLYTELNDRVAFPVVGIDGKNKFVPGTVVGRESGKQQHAPVDDWIIIIQPDPPFNTPYVRVEQSTIKPIQTKEVIP